LRPVYLGRLRYHAAPAGRRVLVDITPDAQALLDQVLPAVQEPGTETMSSLDDRALHAVLDALAVANDALDAAPHDLPPPAARRAPAHLRRDG